MIVFLWAKARAYKLMSERKRDTHDSTVTMPMPLAKICEMIRKLFGSSISYYISGRSVNSKVWLLCQACWVCEHSGIRFANFFKENHFKPNFFICEATVRSPRFVPHGLNVSHWILALKRKGIQLSFVLSCPWRQCEDSVKTDHHK